MKLFLKKGAVAVASDCAAIERYPDMAKLEAEYGPDRFLFVRADLGDEAQTQAAIAAIDSRYGRLDGSCHNVYASVEKPVLELDLSEWESTVRGTLTSTFLVCKCVLPLMIRSGGGAILNTSSVRGHIPEKGCPAYAAAKAGVNQFTRVLAKEYADRGIRANVLVPGDFKSERELGLLSDTDRKHIAASTLLRRSGTPDEINEVAAFLLSDAAAYVTASLYSVDGGFGLG